MYRKLAITISIFVITIHCNCQVSLYVKGGALYNMNKVKETPQINNSQKKSFTWSGGIDADLRIDKDFSFVTGIELQQRSFHRELLYYADYSAEAQNTPVYLHVPIYFNYQLRSSIFRIHFFAGGYLEKGVGGNAKGNWYNFPFPTSGKISDKIQFNNSSDSKLRTLTPYGNGLIAGLGAGLKKYEISLSYEHGLNNAAPKGEQRFEEIKLRSFVLAMRYKLFSFHK
ncbi:MAG: hypothetical protein JWN76_1769 [Chitinophagaceae bacterium]|nr:hypothetical protein [Chitinophagaceae bacterium]